VLKLIRLEGASMNLGCFQVPEVFVRGSLVRMFASANFAHLRRILRLAASILASQRPGMVRALRARTAPDRIKKSRLVSRIVVQVEEVPHQHRRSPILRA
jgi:hypothetical protein